MKNKDGLFKMISSDLRRGVLRPVYVSEDLSVFAVADSFYVATDYTENQEGYVAFLVNSKMVRAMLVDNDFLARLLTTSDKATLSQMMFRLTDKSFQSFQRDKKTGTFDGLTNKLVDPELEQWIAETFGPPPVFTVGDAPKRTLMDSVRSLFKKDNHL